MDFKQDNSVCAFNTSGVCGHREVADQPVVNDSLQSRWFCSQCDYFKPVEEK